MNKRISLLLCMVLSVIMAYAQKDWIGYYAQNLTIKAPVDWAANIEGATQGDILITLKPQRSECFVEITCIKKMVNPNTRANDIAQKRSLQEHFEYMQIDKVVSEKFQKFDTRLLRYTNTYLNEVCKGGIYCFNQEGYTYTIEYFGEDNPQTKKLLEKIINTFSYTSPDKQRNIVEQEGDYVEKEWFISDEAKDSIALAEQQKQEAVAQEKAAKEEKKAQKQEKKAAKEEKKSQKQEATEKQVKKSADQIKKEEQKAKKQEDKAKKEEKKIKKQQQKAKKEEAKAKKEEKKAKKEMKEAEKRAEKAEKEAKEAKKKEEKAKKLEAEKTSLLKDYDDLQKQMQKLDKQQSKLTEDFIKAQNKNDVKKTEKISAKLQKIAEKKAKLNEKIVKHEGKMKKVGVVIKNK